MGAINHINNEQSKHIFFFLGISVLFFLQELINSLHKFNSQNLNSFKATRGEPLVPQIWEVGLQILTEFLEIRQHFMSVVPTEESIKLLMEVLVSLPFLKTKGLIL